MIDKKEADQLVYDLAETAADTFATVAEYLPGRRADDENGGEYMEISNAMYRIETLCGALSEMVERLVKDGPFDFVSALEGTCDRDFVARAKALRTETSK